jgi:integrase
MQTLRQLMRSAWKRKIMLKENAGRERVLTHEEESKYLEAAEQPLRDVATIIVDCGLRPDECFRIKKEDVNLGTNSIYIPSGKTKYSRRHVVCRQNRIMPE